MVQCLNFDMQTIEESYQSRKKTEQLSNFESYGRHLPMLTCSQMRHRSKILLKRHLKRVMDLQAILQRQRAETLSSVLYPGSNPRLCICRRICNPFQQKRCERTCNHQPYLSLACDSAMHLLMGHRLVCTIEW